MSVSRFWRKIPQRYNLVGTQCTTCGRYFFPPPRSLCPPDCRRSGKIVDHKFTGEGTVVTYTVIRRQATSSSIPPPTSSRSSSSTRGRGSPPRSPARQRRRRSGCGSKVSSAGWRRTARAAPSTTARSSCRWSNHFFGLPGERPRMAALLAPLRETPSLYLHFAASRFHTLRCSCSCP